MRSRSRRPRDRAAVRPLAVAATLALAAAPVCVAASSASAAERVDNPFVGADQYVNSYWTANVAEAAAEAGGDLGAKMLTLTDTPTSVWMDRTSAIEGNADGPGLRYHLDAALEQQQGDTPMVFNLVIYNLPGRDCYALASNGLLPATAAGLAEYESEYIDPIADMLAEQQYENLRVVATIEPDSLPNLVTNMHEPKCQQSDPYYRAGVAYALDRLYEAGNVYSYIDAAHSGWLGWDSNAGPAVNVFKDVVTSTEHGYATVAGFVTNTANSTPLHEPFLEDTTFGSGGGTQVRQAEFYEWNRDFDELDWTEHLYSLATAAGFPSSIGMLVDTSRNGWGGPDRPTAASTSTDLNTYVNASRVDRRTHRGAWCNPDGAGLGERSHRRPDGQRRLPPRRLRVGEAAGRVRRRVDRHPERPGQGLRPDVRPHVQLAQARGQADRGQGWRPAGGPVVPGAVRDARGQRLPRDRRRRRHPRPRHPGADRPDRSDLDREDVDVGVPRLGRRVGRHRRHRLHGARRRCGGRDERHHVGDGHRSLPGDRLPVHGDRPRRGGQRVAGVRAADGDDLGGQRRR